MSFLRNTFGCVFAVSLIAFALGNRHTVELNISPVHAAFETPLYLITLMFMFTGFLLGGLIVWWNTLKIRKTARKNRKAIDSLEQQLETTKNDTPSAQNPYSDFFPALPADKNRTAQDQSLPASRNSSIK